MTIGVSPAFFLSACGEQFTGSEASALLPRIAGLGFQAVQAEVFGADGLSDWVECGAKRFATAARKTGLSVSQFVAHFLLHAFGSPYALETEHFDEAFQLVCTTVPELPGCSVITVPLPRFSWSDEIHRRPSGSGRRCGSGRPGSDVGPNSHTQLRGSVELGTDVQERLVGRLRRWCDIAKQSGLSLALEPMPGSLIGGSRGIRLIRHDFQLDIAVNLDTGHFLASGEPPEDVIDGLADCIVGTHLCDNDGVDNQSLRPGAGSVNWAGVFRSLSAIGYGGSYDVEIRCDVQAVDEEYLAGRQFVQEQVRLAQDNRTTGQSGATGLGAPGQGDTAVVDGNVGRSGAEKRCLLETTDDI